MRIPVIPVRELLNNRVSDHQRDSFRTVVQAAGPLTSHVGAFSVTVPKRLQIFYDVPEFGTSHQLTFFGAGKTWDPVWSPTDDVVAMVSTESGNDELWVVRRGEWPAIQLTDNDWEWDKHPSFSPDGNQIIFSSNRGDGRQQIWIMDADGGNPRLLTDLPFEAWDPVWVKYPDS